MTRELNGGLVMYINENILSAWFFFILIEALQKNSFGILKVKFCHGK